MLPLGQYREEEHGLSTRTHVNSSSIPHLEDRKTEQERVQEGVGCQRQRRGIIQRKNCGSPYGFNPHLTTQLEIIITGTIKYM